MKHSLLPWCFGRRFFQASLLCTSLSWAFVAFASVSFTDDFSTGINPNLWLVQSNQPLYSLDTTGGAVRFSKPNDGTNTFQFIGLYLQEQALGDFDVHVDFTNAKID